ncbi:hypothetical protein FXO38_12031 [Capsicum annuum]|nr:hypothetical protein FXO38_12031 [Capsicum annuum]
MVEEINDPLFGTNIFNIRPYKHLIDQVNVDEDELFDKYSVRNTWHASKLWVNPDLPQVVDFKTRYKIQVRVIDGTSFIFLLLWDREATKLIGKSATQLKGQFDETTDSDDDSAYPMELDTILDKNALFKVTVNSHNLEQHVEVYTVLKIYDDEELTKQFQPFSSDYDLPDSNPDNDLNTPTNTPAKISL